MKCPNCAREIRGKNFCEHCGTPVAGLSQTGDFTCPTCQHGNKKGAHFCSKCGMAFTAAVTPQPTLLANQPAPKTKSRSGSGGILVGVGIFMALGLGFIVFAYLVFGRVNRSSSSSSQDLPTQSTSSWEVTEGDQTFSDNQSEEPADLDTLDSPPEDPDPQAAVNEGDYILPPTAEYAVAPIQPRIQVFPFAINPGETMSIQLAGFNPGELVTLDISSGFNGELMQRILDVPDSTGSITVSYTTPEDALFGLYWIEATGQLSREAVVSRFYLNHLLSSNQSDLDGDGLWDSTEDWVAATYGPYYVLDEEEDRLRTGPTAHVFQVTPAPEWWGKGVILTVVGLWGRDLAELADAINSFVHYGDTEAVEIWIQLIDGDYNTGHYLINRVTMYRHSNSFNYMPGEYSMIDNHPVVYSSQFKHGSYASSEECEGSVFWKNFKEDCDGGSEFYALLPPEHNVGELDQPLFTWMDERETLGWMFPGEKVWDQYYAFCGGYDVPDSQRNGSRSYYVDLIVKKFESSSMPFCAGALRGKWFPKPE